MEILSVGIVIFKKGDTGIVCLVENLSESKHVTGKLGLPAGKVKPGESSPQAALREMQEETGLRTHVTSLALLKQYRADIEQKDGKRSFLWDVYRCKNYEGEFVASGETRPQWVRIRDIDKMENLLPNVKNAIREAEKFIESD